MPRFRNLAAGDVRQKTGPLDLVTEADEAAERVITAGLRSGFPGCVVVGEEATAADPSPPRPAGRCGARLRGRSGRRHRELRRRAAAVRRDGGGDRARRDRGAPRSTIRSATTPRLAMRGEGAWIEAPDGRRTDLRVAPRCRSAEMTGNVSWRFLPEPQRSVVCANLPRSARSWDLSLCRARVSHGRAPAIATSCSSTG